MRFSTLGTSECVQEKAPVPVENENQREQIRSPMTSSTDIQLAKQLP